MGRYRCRSNEAERVTSKVKTMFLQIDHVAGIRKLMQGRCQDAVL